MDRLYPKGTRHINLQLNVKRDAQVLDAVLDGTQKGAIEINKTRVQDSDIIPLDIKYHGDRLMVIFKTQDDAKIEYVPGEPETKLAPVKNSSNVVHKEAVRLTSGGTDKVSGEGDSAEERDVAVRESMSDKEPEEV